MGGKNSHRYDPCSIENFLGNMSARVSSQELPSPLQGLSIFMWMLSDGAKTFDDCVRALLHLEIPDKAQKSESET
jgi:hypothetical protein